MLSETPDVKWQDIAGLEGEGAREDLREAVILPLQYPISSQARASITLMPS